MTRPAQRRASRADGTTTQLSRLREALAWYAEPAHYRDVRQPLANGGLLMAPPDVVQDGGKRARAALATAAADTAASPAPAPPAADHTQPSQ